jgi:hypothetical protein
MFVPIFELRNAFIAIKQIHHTKVILPEEFVELFLTIIADLVPFLTT